MKKSKRSDGLVFSTGPVEINNDDSNSDEETVSGSAEVVLRIERKGRGGKTVTVVELRNIPSDESAKLAKEIKTKCGVGGKLKGNLLDIQGDQRSRIKELLTQKNIRVKG